MQLLNGEPHMLPRGYDFIDHIDVTKSTAEIELYLVNGSLGTLARGKTGPWHPVEGGYPSFVAWKSDVMIIARGGDAVVEIKGRHVDGDTRATLAGALPLSVPCANGDTLVVERDNHAAMRSTETRAHM